MMRFARKSTVGVGALAAACAALPASPAMAEAGTPRSIVITAPMTPYLYAYGACVFGKLYQDTADAAIAACAPLRQKIESESVETIRLFHRVNTLSAQRHFARAMDSVDWQAQEIKQGRKYVAPSIVHYMQCVADTILPTKNFIAGVSIDFNEADKLCHPEILPSREPGLTSAQKSRAYTYYNELRVSGRFIQVVPQTAPTPSFRLDGGILGPVSLQPGDPA